MGSLVVGRNERARTRPQDIDAVAGTIYASMQYLTAKVRLQRDVEAC